MAKINSTKRIIIEEFPVEVRSWLKKLIEPLNRFLEQVYFALVNGLTVRENLKAQVNTLTLEASASTVKFSWNLNERPTAVFVANILDTTGVVVSPYSMSWVYDNGQVELTLNGLAANKHTLTILGLV
jgi:hypothetical protein